MIDELVSKQWFNPWVIQHVVKFFTTDPLDFISNVKLRLNRNHTLTNLAIVTNFFICERWEMTFLTNIIETSYTHWDSMSPQPAITTLKAMESTFITCFIIFIT